MYMYMYIHIHIETCSIYLYVENQISYVYICTHVYQTCYYITIDTPGDCRFLLQIAHLLAPSRLLSPSPPLRTGQTASKDQKEGP